MTRGKRPYVPKVRGCHECSQRRIHCDKTHPSCNKCATKGIRCSGFGIRYRFNHDVSTKRSHTTRCETQLYQHDPSSANVNNFEAGDGNYDGTIHDEQDTCTAFGWWAGSSDLHDCGRPDVESDKTQKASDQCHSDGTTCPISRHGTGCASQSTNSILTAEPAGLQPWKQYFLAYFSNKIAPEMVPIDDQHNGWRHLILPIAHFDELVRDAVLSASAFHLSANFASSSAKPNALYQSAIHRLRQRQDLERYDTIGKQVVLLSLLVLLAAVMVNGSSDFRTIFDLLEAAVSAIGGERMLMGSELGLFLVRQFRKFRGYASPLISQAEGVATLSQTAAIRPSSSRGWEDFRYYYSSYPHLGKSMSCIYALHEQACNIYVSRAQVGHNAPALSDLVEKFKTKMESLPPGSAAEHILVWPIFIAALESSTSEQQVFFTDLLGSHHKRNGFANILRALDYLTLIWSGQCDRDWTQLLPELHVFVV